MATLLATAAPAGGAWAQPPANAQPTGGQVVAGAASIAQGATTTTITQTSNRAAINWGSFDVGSQQTVTFNQPSSTAATLNRIPTGSPSQIAGTIQANGQVVIVNPSGVVFTQGSRVEAASLVVSAAGISNPDFMAGKLDFTQPAHPGARVENQGSITVKQSGLAALVAPSVANSGTINARLGHVVLAGAEAATLDMYGDGLLSIDVTREVRRAPDGGGALVTNSGTIRAEGGTVTLTAKAADGLVQDLVTAGGRISTDAPHGQAGRVVIAGIGGSVQVDGSISASGAQAGAVQVTASNAVNVGAGARIAATGRQGGGSIAVGTTLDRARSGSGLAGAVAQSVNVAAGARIDADAAGSGNGGRVVVLSKGQTTQSGRITARGGRSGGNGGSVEISGAQVAPAGPVDVAARAAGGMAGTILLDPADLTIIHGAANGATTGAQVTDGEIDALGATGNVVLSATQLLSASSGAVVSIPHELSLQAGTTLTINAGASLSAAELALAGNSIVVTGKLLAGGSIGLDAGSGGITLAAGSLLAGTGTAATAAAASVALDTTGGGVTQAATGVIRAASLGSATGITGNVALAGTGNAIGTLSGMTVAGNLTLVDGSALTVAGATSGAKVALTAASLAIDAVLTGSTSVALTATQIIQEAALTRTSATGLIATPLLTGTAGGAVVLEGANLVGTLGAFSTPLAFSLVNAQSLSVSGPVTGSRSAGLTHVLLDVTGALALGQTAAGVANAATAASIISTGTVRLVVSGRITEPGGYLQAQTLIASDTGGASFDQPGNQISQLGEVGSNGDFSLVDASTLTVAGTTTADAVTLQASSLLIDATLTGRTSVTLNATHSIQESSTGTGAATGLVITPLLTGTSGAAAQLDGQNLVGTLGTFTTPLSFSLVNAQSLSISGPISAPAGSSLAHLLLNVDGALALGQTAGGVANPQDVPSIVASGTVRLVATGQITEPGGNIQAGTLTVAGKGASLDQPGNQIDVLGQVGSDGDFSLTDSVKLTVNSMLNAGGGGMSYGIVLNAPSIDASTATIDAASLSGATSTGNALFSGTNQIASIGPFTAKGMLVVDDSTGLTVAGNLSGTQVTLDVAGALMQDVNTSITGSDMLSIVGGGSASFAGTLDSPYISVQAQQLITLLDGADIITGGVVLPSGTLNPDQLPGFNSGDPGAYFQVFSSTSAHFVQTGTLNLSPLPGYTVATMRVDLRSPDPNFEYFDTLDQNANGSVTFTNLVGPSADVVLDLGQGTTSGSVDVAELDVIGQNGGSNLTGLVDGLSGPAAAAAVIALATPIDDYLLNGEPVGIPEIPIVLPLTGSELYVPALYGIPGLFGFGNLGFGSLGSLGALGTTAALGSPAAGATTAQSSDAAAVSVQVAPLFLPFEGGDNNNNNNNRRHTDPDLILPNVSEQDY